MQSRDGLTVLFKPYGVKLDITPKVDHRGVIRACADVLSAVTGALMSDGNACIGSVAMDTIRSALQVRWTMVLCAL